MAGQQIAAPDHADPPLCDTPGRANFVGRDLNDGPDVAFRFLIETQNVVFNRGASLLEGFEQNDHAGGDAGGIGIPADFKSFGASGFGIWVLEGADACAGDWGNTWADIRAVDSHHLGARNIDIRRG